MLKTVFYIFISGFLQIYFRTFLFQQNAFQKVVYS